MAKLVAHLLGYGSAMGSNPDSSQKYKMGDRSKGVAKTLQPAKKYTEKTGSGRAAQNANDFKGTATWGSLALQKAAYLQTNYKWGRKWEENIGK